jgi:uncharacterized protein with HEPN domain
VPSEHTAPAYPRDILGQAGDAIERCLERIREAAFRLGDRTGELLPGQPWPDIRGLGNWLRHAYDRIRFDVIWDTVQNDLPALKPMPRWLWRKWSRQPHRERGRPSVAASMLAEPKPRSGLGYGGGSSHVPPLVPPSDRGNQFCYT